MALFLSLWGVPMFCRRFFLILALLLTYMTGSASAEPVRIVSLSPVGTEMLFALGLEKNIRAVTNFCDYPPEAAKKPKVGDFASLNYESLISMGTDLLVLQDIHKQFCRDLDVLKIPYILLKQNSIADVCDSLLRLGRVCGRAQRAAALVSDIQSEIRRVSLKVKGRGVPSVMLCVSRELSEDSITTFYAAGQNNFYNEIISVAGGRNSVKEKRIGYPQISIEGMMKINPDVIIDLVGDKAFYHSKDSIDLDTVFNEKYMKDQWIRSARARAVSEGRIYIMQGTMFLRPGPRVGLVLRSFASAIHPEVSW